MLKGQGGALQLVHQTRSPAFALFDDDDVEVVRASAPRDPSPSDAAEARSRRQRSPDAEVVETRRSKRMEAGRKDSLPALRRLRSRESIIETTPLRRRVHTPRRESTVLDRRKSSHHSRADDSSATPQRRVNGDAQSTHSLDDDAALAARLAMELDHPRRELRSRRPSTDQHISKRQLATLTPTPRSVSPRKRRRVESSPEVDVTSNPATTPGTPSLRRTRSARGSVNERPTPRQKVAPSPPQRKSSRLTNGRSPEKPPVVALPEEEEEDEELPQYVPSERAESQPPANGAATDGETAVDETKYEDADTPATGATAPSRHSVPSDDTMFGVDLARSKLSPVALVGRVSMPITVNGQDEAGAIDDEDADAEGEEDMDAEGEPDVDEEV